MPTRRTSAAADRPRSAAADDLDDLDRIAAGDPSGMLGAAESWPDQWYEGLERARALPGSSLPSAKGVDSVVVCGLGGSGIAGDVLAALAVARSPVPVVVVRGSDLPAFVGPKTLVFSVSYSGGTEETLSCFDAAVARGARNVAVSGHGELARRARAAGVPVLAPVEGLQPRAAFPSLALGPLVVLARMGLAPGLEGDLSAAQPLIAGLAAGLRRDVPETDNHAKQIARALDGYAIHVWGAQGVLAVGAARWKTQLNENAKLPASSASLPELAHNEVVGYDAAHPAHERTALVILSAAQAVDRVDRVRAAAAEIAASRAGAVVEVPVPGDTDVARMAASALLGDFVSIYLALLRGVDPTPVSPIVRIKQSMKG